MKDQRALFSSQVMQTPLALSRMSQTHDVQKKAFHSPISQLKVIFAAVLEGKKMSLLQG